MAFVEIARLHAKHVLVGEGFHVAENVEFPGGGKGVDETEMDAIVLCERGGTKKVARPVWFKAGDGDSNRIARGDDGKGNGGEVGEGEKDAKGRDDGGVKTDDVANVGADWVDADDGGKEDKSVGDWVVDGDVVARAGGLVEIVFAVAVGRADGTVAVVSGATDGKGDAGRTSVGVGYGKRKRVG